MQFTIQYEMYTVNWQQNKHSEVEGWGFNGHA